MSGTSRGWPAEAHDELDELEEDRGGGASPHAARHERVLRLGGLSFGRPPSDVCTRTRASTWHPSGGLGPSDDPRHGLSSTHTSRSTRPSLEQRPARGAGQPVRPPGTEHPPRYSRCAHDMKHLDLLVDRSSRRGRAPPPAAQEGTSPRGYQPRRSRPGRTGLALISKPARRRQKAHKINGGVLKHASREPTYRP